jgi:hypothetical protein
MSNKLKSGIARVDARLLLQALAHIDNNRGVTSVYLADVVGLSIASVKRLIANARQQYGVVISWRRDNSMPSHGEYRVEDWGVFDRLKVVKFLD